MQLIKKNAKGYGYNYTDLAEITKLLDENGISYYQYIEPHDGHDYVMTVVVDEKGVSSMPYRGARIVEAKLSGKDNPVQAYGASLTYARRYSLLMVFGLATTDDDAEGFTRKRITAKEAAVFKAMCEKHGKEPKEGYEDMTPEQYTRALKALEDVSGKA